MPDRKGSLLASLGEEECQALRSVASRRVFRPGTILFREGDPGRVLFLLQSGRVKIVRVAADGAKALLEIRGPGESVGELSLLDGAPRCATGVTIDRVDALLLYQEEFLALLEQYPTLAQATIQLLTGRVRTLSGQMRDCTLLDLRGRLASRLLELARQHGEETSRGIRIMVRITQQELGQMIGGARSNVNRFLSRFQTQGILSLEQGAILIHRPEELWKQVGRSAGAYRRVEGQALLAPSSF
jgi:CRP-like cAMP-binding protein